jgi:transcriptional/translational regulatory protein YebC/TACO1
MGFRPYYNIFDYSYDKHENYFDRVSGVVDNIERLSKEKNLESLINKDIDAIQHNQKQLIKIVNDTTWLQKLCEPFEDETIDIPQNHVII